MRIVFMGTPDFAVPSLKTLYKNHEILSVVTQPDRPRGRGKKIIYTPVKEFAVAHNIDVLQPERLKNSEIIEKIKSYNPDIIVVVAFGQLLPKEILEFPQYGCINVHGSLLPKYRGAAPIQWSIINGESVTGVTTMFMAEGLDTGDMLLKSEIQIDSDDDYGSIHDKLSILGADLIDETLKKIESGDITAQKQDDSISSYAPMIKDDTRHIDWSKDSESIVNLVRGLNPSPCAYSYYNENELFKILKAEVYKDSYNCEAGSIVDIVKNRGFVVKTFNSSVLVTQLQAQGSKKMNASDYMRGHCIEIGKTLS